VSVDIEIKEFIVSHLCAGRDIESLADDYDLLASDVIDSLGIAELISFMEKQYGISVDDSDLDAENFRTVERIVALVGQKRS
jgi:acyl carrier protein